MATNQFSSMMGGDQSRFNNWMGQVNNWAGGVSPDMLTEWGTKFTSPDQYARAVASNMLASTNSGQYLTPGYSQFVMQTAPEAYLLQQMMAPALYGQPAGNDFDQFLANWLSPRASGQYGYGAMGQGEMSNLWNQFTNRAGSGTMPQFFDNLSPSDYQAFQDLALKSVMSPYALKAMQPYLDQAYFNWAAFTKATPWTSFLQSYFPSNQLNR